MQKNIISSFLLLIFCFYAKADNNYTIISYGECGKSLLEQSLKKCDLARFQQEKSISLMKVDCGAEIHILPISYNNNSAIPPSITPLRNTFILFEKGFLGEKVGRILKEGAE